jgi:hypothetical protein
MKLRHAMAVLAALIQTLDFDFEYAFQPIVDLSTKDYICPRSNRLEGSVKVRTLLSQ